MDQLPPRNGDWHWLYAFLDASNSAVVMTDPAGPDNPIVYVNPAFEEVTGYTRADVAGRNCRLLQRDDRHQPGRVALAAAVAQGVACECLLRNYRKDGTLFWNQLYLFPLKDGRGRVMRFVGMQHDVTRERTLLADVQVLAAERERLIAALEHKARRMARLSLDLANAQETERKALARDLHDDLGQRFAALNMLLHRARPHFAAGDALALWDEARQEIKAMIGLARDLSGALRPPGLTRMVHRAQSSDERRSIARAPRSSIRRKTAPGIHPTASSRRALRRPASSSVQCRVTGKMTPSSKSIPTTHSTRCLPLKRTPRAQSTTPITMSGR